MVSLQKLCFERKAIKKPKDEPIEAPCRYYQFCVESRLRIPSVGYTWRTVRDATSCNRPGSTTKYESDKRWKDGSLVEREGKSRRLHAVQCTRKKDCKRKTPSIMMTTRLLLCSVPCGGYVKQKYKE
eukprot:scaffold1605_cov141-Cylindrotheca_fusiformis.AAC.26